MTEPAVLDDVDRRLIARLQTTTVLRYEKQDWTCVGRLGASPAPQTAGVHGRELDDVDRQILIELLSDGRASYAALAESSGLSPAAVRERVLDLLDRGIMTIQTHPVPEAMGIGGFACLAIKASGPVGPIVEAMVRRCETCVVVRTVGRFDVLSEVWFDDADHLAALLDAIRSVQGVSSLDTLPYHRVAHELFGTGLKHR